MNDFLCLPWRGLFAGSMKLWFLRRRCVLCRLRRLYALAIASLFSRFERRYFVVVSSNFRELLFPVVLRLRLSNSLAVTDSVECRYLHDCARATDRAAPSKRQWIGRLSAAITVGLRVLRHGMPKMRGQ